MVVEEAWPTLVSGLDSSCPKYPLPEELKEDEDVPGSVLIVTPTPPGPGGVDKGLFGVEVTKDESNIDILGDPGPPMGGGDMNPPLLGGKLYPKGLGKPGGAPRGGIEGGGGKKPAPAAMAILMNLC